MSSNWDKKEAEKESQGSATIKTRRQPEKLRGREKIEKKSMKNKQTNAREAYRLALSSPSEEIAMLNRTEKKHENKEQGKTQHKTPSSNKHNATQIRITSGSPPYNGR